MTPKRRPDHVVKIAVYETDDGLFETRTTFDPPLKNNDHADDVYTHIAKAVKALVRNGLGNDNPIPRPSPMKAFKKKLAKRVAP